MRKRERENPCSICQHYHKYEEGEVCNICGHRPPNPDEKGTQHSAFSTEILPNFLYVGSYDNASRSELLKAQGISRILNTVPACQNLYKNSFNYHCMSNGEGQLPFDECNQFIEAARLEGAKVLVHCMSGQARSPAVVIAYLMTHKGWRLPQSYQWVKERHPGVNMTQALAQQLQEYEAKLFGNTAGPLLQTATGDVTFGFGFQPQPQAVPMPTFGQGGLGSSPGLLASYGSAAAAQGLGTFVFGSSNGEANMDSS